MRVEIKPAKITDRSEPIEYLFHDIKIARRLVDTPEYFYQQPTPKQEEKFKEDYDILWKRLDRENNIRVPKTIETFFGKVEFIKDELHFRGTRNKYESSRWKYNQNTFLEYEELPRKRRKTFKKLDSLSPEEVAEIKAKTANTPLQVVDLHTGNLLDFSSHN